MMWMECDVRIWIINVVERRVCLTAFPREWLMPVRRGHHDHGEKNWMKVKVVVGKCGACKICIETIHILCKEKHVWVCVGGGGWNGEAGEYDFASIGSIAWSGYVHHRIHVSTDESSFLSSFPSQTPIENPLDAHSVAGNHPPSTLANCCHLSNYKRTHTTI